MRPRRPPFLLASLLSAAAAGYLAGVLDGAAQGPATHEPVAADVALPGWADDASVGATADAATTQDFSHLGPRPDGARPGQVPDGGPDSIVAAVLGSPGAATGVPAAPTPATPDAAGSSPATPAASGPPAVVTTLSPPTSRPSTPRPATPRPTPTPTPRPTPRPAPTPAPTPTPTPAPAPAPAPAPTPSPTVSPTQPPTTTPYSTAQIAAMIRSAAAAHGVDGNCMVSLAQRESGLDPNAYNPGGPYDGLFQFWPATYAAHGGTDIWDPVQQSDVAAAMMAAGDGPGAWGLSC